VLRCRSAGLGLGLGLSLGLKLRVGVGVRLPARRASRSPAASSPSRQRRPGLSSSHLSKVTFAYRSIDKTVSVLSYSAWAHRLSSVAAHCMRLSIPLRNSLYVRLMCAELGRTAWHAVQMQPKLVCRDSASSQQPVPIPTEAMRTHSPSYSIWRP